MNRPFPVILLAILLSLPAFAGEPYIHPAGAWRMEGPQGWAVKSLVDVRGNPLHVFTPNHNAGDDPAAIKRGIWVFAVPVPTDESLETASMGVLVSQLLTSGEPGLKAKGAGKGKLGALEASIIELEGAGVKLGPWRGRVHVAIQERAFLVVVYGAPPGEFANFAPACQAALATMVAPVPLPPRDEPRTPKEPQRARDIADPLAQCVPMIHIMARIEGEPNKAIELGTGSGFIISPEGHVITNRHVVAAQSHGKAARSPFDPVELKFDSAVRRDRLTADVLAISYRNDIALLQIRKAEKWPFLPLADSGKARRGDRVVVAGWPDPSKTSETDISQNEGTLTGVNRDLAGRVTSFRHSARTTAGNSGGPLYDLDLAGVIAAHNEGILSEAHGFKESLGHRAVPANRIVWEFPQVAAASNAVRNNLTPDERRALIGYYLLQERLGPVIIEGEAMRRAGQKDPIVAAYLGRAYVLLGQSERGLALINEGLASEGSRATAALMGARTTFETDDYQQAMKWATEAARLRPNDPDPHLIIGESLMCMGRWADSRRELESALKLSSDLHPEAHMMLGILDLQEWMVGNGVVALPAQQQMPAATVSRARASLQRSLDLWPARNSFAHVHLAILDMLARDGASAAKHRDEAIRVGGADPDPLLGIAWLDLLLGDWQSAMERAGEAYNTRTNARASLMVGWAILQKSQALAKERKPQEAMAAAQEAGKLYIQAARLAPDAHWAAAVKAIGEQLAPAR